MTRKLAMAASAAVILFLPESNRLDLLTVAAVVYGCAFYLVRCIAGEAGRVKRERERLNSLRWVRRDPPKTPSLKGIRDGMAYYLPDGAVWFDWKERA